MHPPSRSAQKCAFAVVFAMSLAAQAPSFAEPSATQPVMPVAKERNEMSDLNLEDLMNVEVTSVSKKKQSISQAPAAVTVIGQDEIARSGYGTIPDLLRLAPGVHVGQINSSTWAIGVRGMNGQFAPNLLVLQDGRSLYSPLFGGTYWNTVDYILSDLERIEVIRGPGATLYGANAVNGVINITTKDAKDTQGWLVATRGSNNDSNLAARYGGKMSDDTWYRVYTKAKYADEFNDAGANDIGDQWSALRGGFRIDKHASDENTFTLQGDVAGDHRGIPFNEPVIAAPFVRPTIYEGTDITGNLLARWNHKESDDSDFTLQVYYDYLNTDSGGTDYDQHTLDVDFHQRLKINDRNEIVWGVGYRLINSALRGSGLASADPSVRNDTVINAFVQDTYTIESERWFVTFGSKFEQNSYTGLELEPSVRLLWTPNKQNSVWASVSRAIRTPARVDDNIDFIGGYTTVPVAPGVSAPAVLMGHGVPDFKSEELVAYELGYRVEPMKRVSMDVAVFYNVYDRLASLSIGNPVAGSPIEIPLFLGNDISGNTYGGEFAATVQVTDQWRLTGSYSLLQANFTFDPNVTAAQAEIYSKSGPQSLAQIRSYLDITRDLQLNASIAYTSTVGETRIPGFISTDLNVVWRPRESLSLKVGVTNLFDDRHPEYEVTSGQGVSDEVPRTFYVDLAYEF